VGPPVHAQERGNPDAKRQARKQMGVIEGNQLSRSQNKKHIRKLIFLIGLAIN
jgi:hypothetical protein